ncbi:hypothetical protein G6011_06505 [Alternaria panax]|uniref:F-box domain-containing protein n=1 Tax=Alternaria panax TaxID=48097 RepID=A0AAD4FGI0_9PLEO|nr:hypothetical protein G6011_06505 [Alternaria panax]
MDNLPDELLFEIINQLFLGNVDDVWNISVTNRRLHQIAKELLYSSYSNKDVVPGLFIRALASSPNLERCVQQVEWRAGGYDLKFPEELTTAELRYVTERVGFGEVGRTEVAGESMIRKLNAWLADREEEDCINIFMLFTRKVKRVVITPKEWSRKVVWFKPALASQMFSNLQEAYIHKEMRIGNVLSLFLLPSMRTLTLSHVGINRNIDGVGPRPEWEANNAFWKRLEREGSSIENLMLSNVGSDTLDLVRALESFQGLKNLEFAFHGHGLGRDDVNVRTLLRAIAHHHGSLRWFHLEDPRLGKDPKVFEEVKTLDHLECLQMTMPVFHGSMNHKEEQLPEALLGCFRNLPRHLKNLRISAREDYQDVPTRFLDVLLSMAPTIDTILPHLEKITFFDWNPQLGTFPCQIQTAALQSALAKADVELESIYDTDEFAELYHEQGNIVVSTIEPDLVSVAVQHGCH